DDILIRRTFLGRLGSGLAAVTGSRAALVGGIGPSVESQLGSRVPQPGSGLNVKAFGAVGDGTADDTAAIQDAIDTAARRGGGSVYLPLGSYRIAAPSSRPSHALQVGVAVALVG